MVSNQDILNKLNSQDRRIKKIETFLKDYQEPEEIESPVSGKGSVEVGKSTRKMPSLSFTQVITFLGVLGIVIGVIYFFFYAVARNWIGETMQVMTGILLGFVLFTFAFMLHKKREGWSNIVFGGAFFIEYISIGVGVLAYKIMPDYVGIMLTVVFLLASTFLSVHFKSRAIAYFTLVGGFLVPFVTGSYQYDIFIMVFYTVLSLGLVVLSFNQNWSDLRFTSFLILGVVLLSYMGKFSNADVKAIPLTFLIVLFVLYHIAALINSFKDSEKNLSILDSIVVVGFTLIFLVILYNMFDWTNEIYGLFIMFFSIIYLIEIGYFKFSRTKISPSIIYSLLGTGIITLNLGLYFLMDIIDYQYFIVIFAIEYVIFSIISEKSEEKTLYNIFSIICLVLVVLFYLIILFDTDAILMYSVIMIVYAFILISFAYLFKKEINFKLNAAAFIIGGFLFIYSISDYLLLFKISPELNQIILSILWLIYTLTLFKQVETKEGKLLVGALLGVTLVKIAFRDLLFLEGIFRIVGFIIFGILLLIGGYLLSKNENK